MLNKLFSSFFSLLPITKHTVRGYSMYPTLHDGDIVLVSKISYWFKSPVIDDIVAVKRVKQRYIIKRIQRIEHGMYFVVGDNKEKSTDSRQFGLVEKHSIIGKVIWHKIAL